jgi:hypothetical protein
MVAMSANYLENFSKMGSLRSSLDEEESAIMAVAENRFG